MDDDELAIYVCQCSCGICCHETGHLRSGGFYYSDEQTFGINASASQIAKIRDQEVQVRYDHY